MFLTLALPFVAKVQAQSLDEKPEPVLTGYSGYFTSVNAGQVTNAPSTAPLLLVPFGDKWLLEGKGSFSDTFRKNATTGSYDGKISYGVGYAQLDYLASRYVTITTGRFPTPFGIYGEHFAPTWIRALQLNVLTSGVSYGGSNGGMLRGAIPAGDKLNITYATYFSAAVTNHMLKSNRTTGGRVSFFLPGPRIEVGASFQQLLQLDDSRSAGMHAVWQPNAIPLSLRSEYDWGGAKGAGYWIESAYRLSQLPHGRPVEVVGRAQQYFVGTLTPAAAAKSGVPGRDTNEADFGLNYYLPNDVRASVSYGRQFALNKNANLWSIGLTYRWVFPFGLGGAL